MKNYLLIITLKPTFFLLLISLTVLFSCTNKKEYEMELKFQREMTSHSLYENDRILLRIEKETADNGGRPNDVTINNHAINIINQRNKSIGSFKMFVAWIDTMGQFKNMAAISGNSSVAFLNYYQKEFNKSQDSLVFQKLINAYLFVEKNILNEDLMNVAGSCNWGRWFDAHVSKTTDTVRTGMTYELAVIPETFDHKFSFVNDDCKLTVYKNGKPVEMKYFILKKGSVYLISLTPSLVGNYEVRGSFSQSARLHKYVMNLKFTDKFVVKE